MTTYNEETWAQTAAYLFETGIQTVDLALVLGTGLSATSILSDIEIEIPYSEIPGFPVSTVDGHDGVMSYGTLSGKKILVLRGRFHYYEGYEMQEITFYVHVLAMLKAEVLFITNAAGGLNPHFKGGDLVLVTDHINLFSAHPLRGQWPEGMGPRFPDLMHAYSDKWQKKLLAAAKEIEIDLKKGVYLGWQGPSLETPAEYKMARNFGADLVGMSTVPEVIVAKFRGLDVAVVSVVSNVCFPLSILTETTIEEVIAVMQQSAPKLAKLITRVISNPN
ncbi:MAG: purine-nucleoside phosphorylase [Saprospiraceae bacterium]|nr:purine-nucleoside phosphorylase [Saprospiraceae bacterium]